MGRLAYLVAVILLTLPLSGCLVSESRYLQKVAETENLTAEQLALQKRYDSLATENSGLKATVDKLEKRLTEMTTEKNRLDEGLVRLAAERKELVQDLKASQNESLQRISELRQKIADQEALNERLKQEVSGLKQEIVRIQKAKEEEVLTTSKTYEQLLDMMKHEISQGQVTISELKGKLTVNMVDAILFDSGKAEVKEDGLAVLRKVIDILKTVKDKSIRIEGHTDNVPIRGQLAARYPTNWELSAARAINVTRYLQSQGIEPQVLAAVAYGEFKPVAANDNEEGKARNRRIEIILVPKE
ncbi:MAG TPA: OmpA family protein [Geobacteraceae bacterium]|nr:OmpA family protein [Geobacteraceae bacterium]